MSTPNCLANRHFLVVDDEEFVRKLIVRFLKQSGAAEVVEAGDGTAAIAAIEAYDMAFDAVVSDINMRPMNGLELLSAIRTGARGLKRNTPVLMLTAYAEADYVSEALALDADAFVVKPVGRDTLIDRVMRVLERTVSIQVSTFYKALGAGGGPGAASAPPVAPNRRLLEVPGGPVASAELVPLDDVKINSILAQDVRFGDAQKLLLAAPVILTGGLLSRLKDLRHLHNSYSHLWVIEPRLIDEDLSAPGGGGTESSALAALHVGTRNVPDQMIGAMFLAPALSSAETAAKELVGEIRSQTDEIAVRAQARVDEQHAESGPL